MRPSPSSTFCNLSLSGNSLFYAHTTQACTLQPGSAVAKTPINVRRVSRRPASMQARKQHIHSFCAHTGSSAFCPQVECQCQDFVHTARALPHGETGFLLVCTEGGVQVRTHCLAQGQTRRCTLAPHTAPSQSAQPCAITLAGVGQARPPSALYMDVPRRQGADASWQLRTGCCSGASSRRVG